MKRARSNSSPSDARRWIEVEARLEATPADWSLFADAFTRYGCTSSLVSDNPPSIKGYLESVAGAAETAKALSEALKKLGAEVIATDIPDQDWSEIWKTFFKPRRVGRRFVIVPNWEDFEAGPDDLVLNLDPGQAFGTGEHPTTRLCLELMEDCLPPPAPPSSRRAGTREGGGSVLDLGCGSGVLAIAAKLLGATLVTASDIEPSSVEIARENAARNGVAMELFAGDGFDDWASERQWDVLLSNIISAAIIRLAPEAGGYVSPGGKWIVSGILKSNWGDVRSACEHAGFSLCQVREEDDWIGAVFEKR